MTETESDFLHHTSCPACGSSDANAVYSDGHTYCHRCAAYVPAEGASGRQEPHSTPPKSGEWLGGEFQALTKRGISEETCRKFGYKVGRNKHDQPVQIAEYRDDNGRLIGQKLRTADKKFNVIGTGADLPLFGQHLWAAGGRRVVITEGEIDTLSVAQVFNLRWPVVSLPNGAQGAEKALKRSIEWLESFEEVVLCFDQDEPARAAMATVAPLFTPGKCKIAELPLKDANELLVADRAAEIVTAIYQARTYRPDGIVALSDIRAEVLRPLEVGRPWPWQGLTSITFGRRLGECYGFGAGTGVGKTDVFTQIIAHDVMTLGVACGVLMLEQKVAETGRRVAGKVAGKRYHVPDGSWTEDELAATLGQLEATGKLYLYDSWGVMDWETIKSRIRYMAVALGCRHVFLDHLTALAAAEDDERTALERIMSELAGLATSLGICLHFISHLATPEGKPHEEGGRVSIRHFKGSRAIGFWSHAMFGMERDQQAEDEEARCVTRLRVLKDRYTGNSTGSVILLRYDRETGLLVEIDDPEFRGGMADCSF